METVFLETRMEDGGWCYAGHVALWPDRQTQLAKLQHHRMELERKGAVCRLVDAVGQPFVMVAPLPAAAQHASGFKDPPAPLAQPKQPFPAQALRGGAPR